MTTSSLDNFTAQTPSKLLLLIALIQGLCLLLLHQSVELAFWPFPNLTLVYGLYGFVLSSSVLLLFCLRHGYYKKTFLLVLPIAALIGVAAGYTGSLVYTSNSAFSGGITFTLIATLTIATFKAAIYLQQLIVGHRILYHELFIWSWRIFLSLSFSLLFSGIFFAILMLSASLFKAINIHFFYDIFTEKWFFYPVIALAHGFAIIMIRNMINVMDVVARIQQTLSKFLLIMSVAVAVLFLIVLPFTGLDSLWSNGGSELIFWMQLITLFFVNSVYQNSSQANPYPPVIHRAIYISVALLPAYSFISLYGLTLRIGQYGFTVERLWALMICLLLTLYTLTYLVGIIKKRDRWTEFTQKANIALGLVVLTSMLLVNSPLLDFRKITSKDQIERLLSGKTTLNEIDPYYYVRTLHKPGVNALRQLQDSYGESHPEFANRVTVALQNKHHKEKNFTKQLFHKKLNILGVKPPENLVTVIYDTLFKDSPSNARIENIYLLDVNMAARKNENLETQFISISSRQHYNEFNFWHLSEGIWQRSRLQPSGYSYGKNVSVQAVVRGEYKIVEPKWKDFQIGDVIYKVQEKKK